VPNLGPNYAQNGPPGGDNDDDDDGDEKDEFLVVEDTALVRTRTTSRLLSDAKQTSRADRSE